MEMETWYQRLIILFSVVNTFMILPLGVVGDVEEVL